MKIRVIDHGPPRLCSFDLLSDKEVKNQTREKQALYRAVLRARLRLTQLEADHKRVSSMLEKAISKLEA